MIEIRRQGAALALPGNVSLTGRSTTQFAMWFPCATTRILSERTGIVRTSKCTAQLLAYLEVRRSCQGLRGAGGVPRKTA